jgi:hypothetical protein
VTTTDDGPTSHLPQLPGPDDLGKFGVWVLPMNDGTEVKFEGHFLGMSSSRKPNHEGHNGHAYGMDGTWTSQDRRFHRCGACRWFEPRIFVQSDGHRFYGLYKLGATIVPGEVNRISFEQVGSPMELIELLTVTKDSRTTLTIPGRRVIAQATGYDDAVKEAYLDWRATE